MFFSCVVTAIFLRPIFKILAEVGGVRSLGRPNQLEKAKWLTLLGASLAVLSSTAMHINGGLYAVLGGNGKPFYTNPYLNIFVFGINLDSLLNDIGMLLVSDAIKTVPFLACFKRPCAKPRSVAPFDSDSDDNATGDNKKRRVDVSGSAESSVGMEKPYSYSATLRVQKPPGILKGILKKYWYVSPPVRHAASRKKKQGGNHNPNGAWALPWRVAHSPPQARLLNYWRSNKGGVRFKTLTPP
jgi:hypothetical protein